MSGSEHSSGDAVVRKPLSSWSFSVRVEGVHEERQA